ncbi:hypothetical protein [Aquabacter cavernae]|uniref:hypothetical protein n=1 Tax=Aquabacter cavernae TaxID=2496029 RepID=UPI000F8C9AAD|nr:hypothetical protein [Aquabacter cavernae]
MDARDDYVNRIKLAENQFRLACTVHLAVCNELQTLDVPVEWNFGRHRVSYREFGLRSDQAPLAASLLEDTAMFALVSTIRDALVNVFPNTKSNENTKIVSAYQISRMIRNAFAHSMVDPVWSIDSDCVDRVFAIEDVIEIKTRGIHGKRVKWTDYGGPLAIFHFGRFVREVLLESPVDPNRKEPDFPSIASYQLGRMVWRKVDELPNGLVEVARAGPGESIDLGNGYRLVNLGKENTK